VRVEGLFFVGPGPGDAVAVGGGGGFSVYEQTDVVGVDDGFEEVEGEAVGIVGADIAVELGELFFEGEESEPAHPFAAGKEEGEGAEEEKEREAF
jgi:hypothetical protein